MCIKLFDGEDRRGSPMGWRSLLCDIGNTAPIGTVSLSYLFCLRTVRKYWQKVRPAKYEELLISAGASSVSESVIDRDVPQRRSRHRAKDEHIDK